MSSNSFYFGIFFNFDLDIFIGEIVYSTEEGLEKAREETGVWETEEGWEREYCPENRKSNYPPGFVNLRRIEHLKRVH